MKYQYKLILILLLFPFLSSYAQQLLADSLENQLKLVNGEKKVELYSELADVYQYINTKTAIEFASKGIELATSINYQLGLAACYGSLGYCYINLDNEKALHYTRKALNIRKQIDDTPGIASSLNVMGVIYYYRGDYLPSIEYHLQAMKLREEVGDEVKTATSYNNIALVYLALEDYPNALQYLYKALRIRIKTNNKRGIAIIKDNIGDIYSRMGQYEKAFGFLRDALKLNVEIGNKKSEANTNFNIAKIYRSQHNNSKAMEHFNRTLMLYKEQDEKHGIAITENGIAGLYISEMKVDLAIKHANTALQISREINSLDNISRAADILQQAYKAKEDYKKAYDYLAIYQVATDSLKTTDKIKKLSKIELDYKVDKIREEQKTELDKQKLYVQTLIIILILGLAIIVMIIREYGSKRKTNEKLNHLNNQLKELNASKDKFFSIIAHDLRGPFQSLFGFTEILATQTDSLSKDEVKEYSEGLNQSLHKQYDLLNDLLDWSRLQNGNFDLSLELISLREEVDSVISALSLTAAQKGVKLINSVDKNVAVTADSNMLRLVLRNLITNSIKFSNKEGAAEISCTLEGNVATITVTDNGIGINESDQEKLFRIDTHITKQGTNGEMGTGLGLILCKEIIERHSGKIIVDSAPGKGSKFIFTMRGRELPG